LFKKNYWDHGTKILRNRFGFDQIAPKIPLPSVFAAHFHIQNHHFSALILGRFSNKYSLGSGKFTASEKSVVLKKHLINETSTEVSLAPGINQLYSTNQCQENGLNLTGF
jgi:hypothetical protein